MGIYDSIRENYNSECDITVRRNIQDIVRSYHNFWDPFNELIQNSIDAINRRYRIINDPTFYLYDEFRNAYPILDDQTFNTGEILIEVWPSKKIIRISDNGTGIQNDRICKLLCPDSSDKRKGQEYGYKGKGLTFSAFITSHFNIITKFFLSSDTYRFTVDGLYNWLQDDTSTIPFPATPMVNPAIEPLDSIGNYNTIVELTLEDDYASRSDNDFLDNVFSLFDDENAIQCFEVLLRSKTGIGNTCGLFGKNPIVPINIDLKVYNDDSSIMYDKPVQYKFYHPSESVLYSATSYEFNDYVNNSPNLDSQKFSCLYFSTNEPVEIGIRRPVRTNFHIIMISSTNLNTLNEYLGFAGGYDEPVNQAKLKSGVYLSIDGMPTGIVIDDWSKRGGEFKKYYVIADCELSISDELDAGRKGISEGRANQISNYAYELISSHKATSYNDNNHDIGKSFYTYSKNLLYNKRTPPSYDDFDAKVSSANEQANYDSTNLENIYNYLKSHTSLIHTPQNEEEVRALFHELLSQRIIKGYKTVYAAANRADYDAAFQYELELDGSILEEGDKLGIPQVVRFTMGRDRNRICMQSDYRTMGLRGPGPLCAEFKHTATDLIREIRSIPTTTKDPNRIDLLIVWDADEASIRSIIQSCGLTTIHQTRKYLHSTTHRLIISTPEVNTEIFVISLKQLLIDLTN